jgi:DNA-binding transcriptional LysR family regulator
VTAVPIAESRKIEAYQPSSSLPFAQQALSYTIAHLELQLGVPLFDRDRTRKSTLTKAGAAVLSEARTVRVGVDNLQAKVKGLLEGLEPEIALVVDVMLLTSRLVDAMQASAHFRPLVYGCMSKLSARSPSSYIPVLLISVSASRATAMFRDLSGSGSAVWT